MIPDDALNCFDRLLSLWTKHADAIVVPKRSPMCQRCKVVDARRTLLVDPGPDLAVTILGHFCIWCAKNELADYLAGRKVWAPPEPAP